jgi:hypothetical protein
LKVDCNCLNICLQIKLISLQVFNHMNAFSQNASKVQKLIYPMPFSRFCYVQMTQLQEIKNTTDGFLLYLKETDFFRNKRFLQFFFDFQRSKNMFSRIISEFQIINIDRKFYCAYDPLFKMTQITILISANQEEGPKIKKKKIWKKILPSSSDSPPKLL